MSPTEFLLILIVVGYAIYRQSRKHEIVGRTRFNLAILYAVIGLIIGGTRPPSTTSEWVLLVVSLLLSLVVGLMRGHWSKLWRAPDGRVYSQGTVLTVGLFLALVIVKFAIGTAAYFLNISDGGNFGEILLMIAVMIAFQAELVWRRAKKIGAK